jgi:adenylate kinase
MGPLVRNGCSIGYYRHETPKKLKRLARNKDFHRDFSRFLLLLGSMKTIILVGIPGSGKSTILQEAMRVLPYIQVVNYGDQMLEEAAFEGISRDSLRKLPFKDQQKIGVKAAKKMIQKETNKITIIDTHALIRTDAGFCPGLPLEVLEILSPKALVWVECQPSIIIQRRSQDSARKRDLETEEELSLHQELTRSFLAASSMYTGAILCRISNEGQSVQQNAAPLIHLLQKISKEHP